MKIDRRGVLASAGAALAAVTFPRPALALGYPDRPVRLVVGFPPGGSADILTRLVAQALREHMGQPFFVDNRAGAGSNLAAADVARAEPDGYTLLLVTAANAVNATLYSNLPFDYMRDFDPIGSIAGVPMVMVINISVPAKTVPDFIAYAKANPGKVFMGSTGVGTSPHVAGVLFNMMAGVDIIHVPYRGAANAKTDMLAGNIQVLFDTLPAAIADIRSGRVRALAVTTKTRSATLPDVPAISEYLPGYEATAFYGLAAPKGTPPEVVTKLNAELNAALQMPDLSAKIVDLGGVVMTGTPAEFGSYVGREIEKWAKVIRFSGAKAQ